ncbi:MAG TPA: PIN domain-containing protein [Opitutales bacterium]|nr:PIN domain-containing protein [Opitutales bacterium]
MNKNLLTIRILFFFLCIAGSWLITYTIQEWDDYRLLAMVIGALIGTLVILVDILLKGFSLRGMTAVTFGLGVGATVAFLIATSPLFENGDPEIIYLSRLALFVICTYLGAVLALRGKDEFNLVIPYVRFVPHEVQVPLIVVDTSALIDGRIVKICRSHFISSAIVIPQFVLDELRRIANSSDPVRKEKGRRGLLILNELKEVPTLDLRIEASDVDKREDIDAKLIFLASSLKAKILTMDYSLAKMAEFHGLTWLNINELSRSLVPEVVVGETLLIKLVKKGKEPGQAVAFLDDGSMVVVNDAEELIGEEVVAEIVSVLPSAGGKIVFATYTGFREEAAVPLSSD